MNSVRIVWFGSIALLAGCGSRASVSAPPVVVEAAPIASGTPRHATPKQHKKKAIATHELREDACDVGTLDACNELGVAYEDGSSRSMDVQKAAKLFAQGCERGGGIACGNLAGLYLLGQGVAKDDLRGASLAMKGCDAGSLVSCTVLGSFFFAGRGVKKDANRGKQLWEESCEKNEGIACAGLGVVWGNVGPSNGFPNDLPLALKFHDRACDLANKKGCLNAANAYRAGIGTKVDEEHALEIYERGCALGEQNCCYAIGESLVNHDGDQARAAKLLDGACNAGVGDACAVLAQIAKRTE